MSGQGRQKSSSAGSSTLVTKHVQFVHIGSGDSYDDWAAEVAQAAAPANRPATVRIVLRISIRRRGRVRLNILPQESFIRAHGIAVDPLRNGNCGIDAVGLAVSYLQTKGILSTSNNTNNAAQLRLELHNHARTHRSAFSRHYENLIKDSQLDSEEWFTQNVLNRLHSPGVDYSSKATVSTSQWLDGDYGCPIVADFFQVKMFLYDLKHGSTTIYSPNISGHRTRRRTPQVTTQHLTQMEPPTPGSVAIMKHNCHFYWLMPRLADSDQPEASVDTIVVEVDADGSSNDDDDDDDDDGDGHEKEGEPENAPTAKDDAIVVEPSSDEDSDGDDDGGGGDDDDGDGGGDNQSVGGLSQYELDDDDDDGDGHEKEGMSSLSATILAQRFKRNGDAREWPVRNKRWKERRLWRLSAPRTPERSSITEALARIRF